jgi:hypothetical protein
VEDARKFSLVLGGPLFLLLCRIHLSDDVLLHVRQRVIAISLFAWLPLLVLSALHGDLLGHHIAVTFLSDMEVHIRFLLAVPLLIIAELVVHRRLHGVALAFLDRKLISRLREFPTGYPASMIFRLRPEQHSLKAKPISISIIYRTLRLAPCNGLLARIGLERLASATVRMAYVTTRPPGVKRR